MKSFNFFPICCLAPKKTRSFQNLTLEIGNKID